MFAEYYDVIQKTTYVINADEINVRKMNDGKTVFFANAGGGGGGGGGATGGGTGSGGGGGGATGGGK